MDIRAASRYAHEYEQHLVKNQLVYTRCGIYLGYRKLLLEMPTESEPLPPTNADITAEPIDEIEALRARSGKTRRVTAPALEEILYSEFQVLDHGFVRVVDYMGDDAAIVQAARVSYGQGTKSVRNDAGLIRYLLRHRHTTPFEMCEIKLHVKLPIFVARQWIRHRTASVNEYSARYSILDREFYVPDVSYLERRKKQRREEKRRDPRQYGLFGTAPGAQGPLHTAPQSKSNKQGRAGEIDENEAEFAIKTIKAEANREYTFYETLLNEKANGELLDSDRSGLARELARMILPTNFYTQWYWKVNLHNLMHFLSLRADAHAQYEIRAYAEVILDEIVRRWVPLTYQAFQDYRLCAVSLSAPALAVVQRMLAGETVTQEDSGLSPREWQELMAALEQ